jgi:hypothetical protein
MATTVSAERYEELLDNVFSGRPMESDELDPLGPDTDPLHALTAEVTDPAQRLDAARRLASRLAMEAAMLKNQPRYAERRLSPAEVARKASAIARLLEMATR